MQLKGEKKQHTVYDFFFFFFLLEEENERPDLKHS